MIDLEKIRLKFGPFPGDVGDGDSPYHCEDCAIEALCREVDALRRELDRANGFHERLAQERDELRSTAIYFQDRADAAEVRVRGMRLALKQIREHCANTGYGNAIINERIVDRCDETAAMALAIQPEAQECANES